MLLDAAGALQVADDSRPAANDESGDRIEELILRARTGDAYAFERLMAQFERQVLCTAGRLLRRREEAKDAAQEVFLKLYRYLPRISPRAVRTWLYRVTVTVCRDLARRSEKLALTALEEDAYREEFAASWPERSDQSIHGKEQRAILNRALWCLPFKERAALVLRDIEGLSTEETARALGSLPVTVRSQISSARVKVRRHCQEALRRPR